MKLFKESDADMWDSKNINKCSVFTTSGISIAKANAIFNERMKVGFTSCPSEGGCRWNSISDNETDFDTHKIYYITEEIKKEDTAESLLKEVLEKVKFFTWDSSNNGAALIPRIEKLLEKKGGE